MRTTNFARALCAIAVCGLAINSACAPDKKKTPVGGGRNGAGGSGAGAAGSVPATRAAVTTEAGRCSPNAEKREVSELQPLVSKMSQLATTPIEFAQLPQGQYRLAKTFASVEVAAPSLGGGSGGFSVYRESSVSTAANEAKDVCDTFAFSGQAPDGFTDTNRNFPIDSFFEIPADRKVRVEAGSFRFALSQNLALADVGVTRIRDEDMEALKGNKPAVTIPANTPTARRAQLMAAANAAPEIPTPIKLFAQNQKKEIGFPKQGNANATTTAQIYKISETEYAIVISFSENPTTTKKVVLVYGLVSTAATTKAGTNGGMTNPSFKTPSAPNPSQTPVEPAAPAAAANPGDETLTPEDRAF